MRRVEFAGNQLAVLPVPLLNFTKEEKFSCTIAIQKRGYSTAN